MTPSNYNSAQLPFGTVPPVVLPAFTLADYREELKDLAYQADSGCGNHGCCIAKPSGQATNGGCICYPHRIARRLRQLADAIERSGKLWQNDVRQRQEGAVDKR